MNQIEKIKAEIERRTGILTRVYAEQVERKDEEMQTYYRGKIVALEELRSFIESLEKEQFVQGPLTDEYFNRYYTENFDMIHSDLSSREIVRNIAEHFYELGLNVRKENEK